MTVVTYQTQFYPEVEIRLLYAEFEAAVQLEKDRAEGLVQKLRLQTERGDEVYKKYQDLLEKLEVKAMQEERKSVENT